MIGIETTATVYTFFPSFFPPLPPTSPARNPVCPTLLLLLPPLLLFLSRKLCVCVCVCGFEENGFHLGWKRKRVRESDWRGRGGENDAHERKKIREKWELSRWKLNIIFTTYFSVRNWNLYPKITVYAFEIFNKNFRLFWHRRYLF